MQSGDGCLLAVFILWTVIGFFGMIQSPHLITLIIFLMGLAGLIFFYYQYNKSKNTKNITNSHKQIKFENTIKTSEWEKDIAEFVSKQLPGYTIKRNDRTIIPAKNGSNMLELDIYIPEKHIAIECNGEHWHDHKQYTEDKENKTEISEEMYKENACREKGIKLIHVWDSESIGSIKSRLMNELDTI